MARKVGINQPLNWEQLKMAESVKSLYFEVDEENNIKAQPVILLDPRFSPTSVGGHISALDPTGLTRAIGTGGYPISDFYPATDLSFALLTQAAQYVKGAANSLEVVRTPTSVVTAIAAAATGTTAVWTPAAGKKFRALKIVVTMSGLIAAAAIRNLTLIEETAGTVIARTHITIPVLGGTHSIAFDLGPNGFLASTADKKLQVVTAGGTYSTGQDTITVYGTEE